MDKALLNRDDIDALLAWRDEHKDLVRSAPAPLKAIEIICPVYIVRAFRNTESTSDISFFGNEPTASGLRLSLRWIYRGKISAPCSRYTVPLWH